MTYSAVNTKVDLNALEVRVGGSADISRRVALHDMRGGGEGTVISHVQVCKPALSP